MQCPIFGHYIDILVLQRIIGGQSPWYFDRHSKKILYQNPAKLQGAGRQGCRMRPEVFRPGEYELLPGETLKELIEHYADGFTLGANPLRIRLSRINTRENIPGESRVFSYKENEGLALEDRDVVSVSNKIENRPIIFFEGAVSTVVQGMIF
jgi:hypothetical protein